MVKDIPHIRVITVSGRIAAGSTSLAKHLAEALAWKRLEGGDIFWEAIRKKMDVNAKDTNLRPDQEDILFEEQQKKLLSTEKHLVLESKLAGFCAQGITDVFKVGVVCEDNEGQDQTQIRIDRLLNRERISVEEAKAEVFEREENDLSKWRRLYAQGDPNWVYWNKNYFDLIINTYIHSPEESLQVVLKALGVDK